MKISRFDVNTLVKVFRVAPEVTLEPAVDCGRFLSKGLVFVKNNQVVLEAPGDVVSVAVEAYALSNVDWSKSFHKSWDTVSETLIEELLYQQFVHYFSTYGLESRGYNACPIIPAEDVLVDLEAVPGLKAFTVIRLTTDDEIISLVSEYIKTVKALPGDTRYGIINLMNHTKVLPEDIASNELRVARCDQLNRVPLDGTEFLRYVVYKVTGETLLIKNRHLIKLISTHCNAEFVTNYFIKADKIELAEIFFRYKPLFLAFRSNPQCRPIINQIRRLANIYHKPLSDVNVRNASNLFKEGRTKDFESVLSSASLRELVKLYNFSEQDFSSNIYSIRNGKSYLDTKARPHANIEKFRACVLNKILDRVRNKLIGKTYYIPEYIQYVVPTSEKGLISGIPVGSSVSVAENPDFCIGIYWENTRGKRTDIDLHMTSVDGQRYGWNSGYKSADNNSVLFSGDMTDASDGAVEAFSFTPAENFAAIFSVNLFNGEPEAEFKFLMTDKGFSSTNACVCDVKDALFEPINLKFSDNKRGLTLGFVDGFRFYFNTTSLNSCQVPDHDLNALATKTLCNKVKSMLPLVTILRLAGAKVITEYELAEMNDEDKSDIIDLSPNSIAESTIINIIDSLDG